MDFNSVMHPEGIHPCASVLAVQVAKERNFHDDHIFMIKGI
jgi:hypothetical protein